VNTDIKPKERRMVRGPWPKPEVKLPDNDKKLTCIRGPLGKPELFDEM
jgi:hypothetical protein